jgi:hypothetical protein
MIPMRMMKPSVHNIIDVVTVGDGFMSAVRTVLMAGASDFRRAVDRVRRSDRDDMFVNMIPLHMVKMAVVKIVNMAFMADSCVSAIRAMLMGHASSPSRSKSECHRLLAL